MIEDPKKFLDGFQGAVSRFSKADKEIRDNYLYDTEIIVAAVRNARQIIDAAVLGADIVTAGLPVYQEGVHHPYTLEGIQKFITFWDQTQYE